ncbi:GGDEF domain-containing protein [Mariprofundus sp. KV]|uniref:GGDEF domain-containing protein n=1 Tax=Mariprofundus sp. KV TaxID=2608715 RepID=UPI0015A07C44|nr:GGDEF domain-containing protein [Mariprofundus sp. KV]NWF37433.1 GGDEF domain-containing protein [Mariprofundus sp. KV]
MPHFHYEAECAATPILGANWQDSPESAIITFQNEKAISRFGDLRGRTLLKLFDDILENSANKHINGQKLLKKLMNEGSLKAVAGSLAGMRVELFASVQQDSEKTIQMSLFDVTERFLDHLSQIPGRELFFDLLDMELHRATRDKTELHVCFLDLDGFKQTNDLYGHKAGDDVIVEVARRLKRCLRKHETVARFGGDEFVMLLSGKTIDSVHLAEKKIIPLINEPYHSDGHVIDFIGASIGVSYAPAHTSNADELINHADDAMYVAKDRGKNQIVVFEPGMEGMKKH